MTTTTATAGQALTAEIRKMYRMSARTRWNRKGGRTLTRDLVIGDLCDAIGQYRGIESEHRTAVLDKAHAALCAWSKFVANYRIDGVLRYEIMEFTPWQLAGFLGEMVDSGCSNMAEFEMWFQQRTRDMYAARNAAA